MPAYRAILGQAFDHADIITDQTFLTARTEWDHRPSLGFFIGSTFTYQNYTCKIMTSIDAHLFVFMTEAVRIPICT